MQLVLKRFSQDVDLSDPGNVLYYLVFDTGGLEVRLPVPKETSEALIQLVYGTGEKEDHQGESPPEIEEALKDAYGEPDEFGGEEDDDNVVRIPSNEGEIPSI